MRNAKKELLSDLNGEKPLCATIEYVPFNWEGIVVNTFINLKVGYTQQDWEEFLTKLDFEYDDGYGAQELFGMVWVNNKVWLYRDEYDGSEWWVHSTYPEIPDTLL
jgi:hypothetical protein